MSFLFFLLMLVFRAQNATSVGHISLNVQSKDAFIGFAAQLEIADGFVFGPQQLLIDTGSSIMTFCNNKLRTVSQGGVMTYPGGSSVMYLGPQNDQCIGGPYIMAGFYGTNPSQSFFWGYVYEGDLRITSRYDNYGENSQNVSQVAYAITEQAGPQFPCSRVPGLDGVWGVGFSGYEAHSVLPHGRDFPMSDVLCFREPCNSTTFDPVDDWCYCDGTESSVFYLEPAVTKMLKSSEKSLLGIYLSTDVSNYTKLVQGRITYDAGMLYLGDSAIYNNSHYDINSVHATVKSTFTNQLWNLPITKIQVNCKLSTNQSSSLRNYNAIWMRSYCLKHGCMLDDNNPHFVLPSTVIEQINSCSNAANVDRIHSNLFIHMGGEALQFNLKDVQTLCDGGWIQSSDSYGGMVILGFSIWLWYYIVFDYNEGTVGKATLSFASISKGL